MERAQVADFYRGKGYLVHESIVVTGQSGNQQRVPLLCEGPLGNLAVFFGDAAGIDGPEIGAAKRVARDLGATAVVAAGTFTAEQRGHAAELGVVLLDNAAMGVGEAPAAPHIESAWPGQTPRQSMERDLQAHPWPASGRPGGQDAAREAALVDIDQVAERAAARLAPAAPQASRFSVELAPAAPIVATPASAVSTTRSDDRGLWKHARTGTSTATVAPQPTATHVTRPTPGPANAGRFAWLDLPKQAAPAAELEYDETISARPAQVPLTPEQEAAQRQARLLREAQIRDYVKYGAWTLGGAVALYLFLIWWF